MQVVRHYNLYVPLLFAPNASLYAPSGIPLSNIHREMQ